ncbi:N-6 DNA methylase, partial [Streptosporangium sp. NPDC001682]
MLRRIWGAQWLNQPYLIEIARPLHDWLEQDEEPSVDVVKAARAVAQAAIKSGLLSITGNPDPQWRCQEDVLGAVLTTLRSKGGRDALAEFHTPTPVADMMAKMLLTPDSIKPGMSFDEPAAGTGGMLRALALALREHDRNPHDYVWSMGELNPTAAACAAVNAIVWDLGPNVLIHVGNTLA